jgi:hypothetical protein
MIRHTQAMKSFGSNAQHIQRSILSRITRALLTLWLYFRQNALVQLCVLLLIPNLDCCKTDNGMNHMKSRTNVYQKQCNHWVVRGIYDLEDCSSSISISISSSSSSDSSSSDSSSSGSSCSSSVDLAWKALFINYLEQWYRYMKVQYP